MLSYQVEENLEMRLVSERYAGELNSVVRDNLAYLHEWLPWPNEDYSVQTARDFIKFRLELFANNEAMAFLIFQNEKIVGGIGFDNPNPLNRSIEIGYWLKADAQGNGIITKCCRDLINYCLNELKINRIVIRCATENIRSQAIPERLGFTKEGILREAEWLHDKFVDLIVYSILKEEWEKQ